MKIAIIGSGIAGLAAAWHLGQRHQVTIFEKHASLGMAAHGLDWGGARVDVPLRVLYQGYYPNLMRLYAAAGIETTSADYAAAFCDPSGRSYFRYRNWRPWARHSIPILQGGRPLGRRARHICADLGRFYLGAWRDRRRLSPNTTVAEYLQQRRFSAAFREQFLLPTFAAISTCDYDSVLRYPARIIVEYLTRGVLLDGVRRTVLGADHVVAQLSRHIEKIHLNSAIATIAQSEAGMTLSTTAGERLDFDHLVVATQANQAAQLIGDCDPAARAALEKFRYEASEVIVHTDKALMPRQRRDWSPVNFYVDPAASRPMATIWLNATLPIAPGTENAFQTWEPLLEPNPDRVLTRAAFERPVVDNASQIALAELRRMQQKPGRRLWFCGSYAHNGVPLLESAASSALAVAQAIDNTHAP